MLLKFNCIPAALKILTLYSHYQIFHQTKILKFKKNWKRISILSTCLATKSLYSSEHMLISVGSYFPSSISYYQNGNWERKWFTFDIEIDFNWKKKQKNRTTTEWRKGRCRSTSFIELIVWHSDKKLWIKSVVL